VGKGHQDKIAVVTGAAAGIGQAFAKRLAEDGAHVVVADIAPASDTVAMIEQAGREALTVACDVTSPEAIHTLKAEVEKRFSRCDILINNAGIYPMQPFDEMSYGDWRKVMTVNLDGPFLLASAFVPGMKARGWGRIVNMATSMFATVVTHMTHYVASKGGVIGFTRALATELGPRGITVNAIAAGLTRTPGLRRRDGESCRSINQELVTFARMQAIQRTERPDDLVGTMSFLTGDDSAFVTGQTIYVDGGKARV